MPGHGEVQTRSVRPNRRHGYPHGLRDCRLQPMEGAIDDAHQLERLAAELDEAADARAARFVRPVEKPSEFGRDADYGEVVAGNGGTGHRLRPWASPNCDYERH